MKIRSIALLAMSIPCCVSAANLSGAPLAIYYAFDHPPAAALVTEMQAELNRILAGAGVRVAWRAIESPRNGEDFQGIVFLRFHGACSSGPDAAPANLSGLSLAETDIADGHVLPFGAVDCDRLWSFIAPALKSMGTEEKNAALGRAMARVSTHEIYHMLTGSEEHARRGIARGSHTRADLTAPAFAFAPRQTEWLRDWAARKTPAPAIVAASHEINSPLPASTASDPGASGGR
jgi:hypothetical protein